MYLKNIYNQQCSGAVNGPIELECFGSLVVSSSFIYFYHFLSSFSNFIHFLADSC